MFKNNVKQIKPLIHCITNYVTVNDVANILLSSGASPVMADSINEVSDITSISNALYLNIGTINERTIESMLLSIEVANDKNIPIILDPVGVGASPFRNECIKKILSKGKISVIRANISEIKAIANTQNNTRGVDANEKDLINTSNQNSIIKMAKALSYKLDCIIAISGKTDIICNKEECLLINNGDAFMSSVTGTGCMLTSLIAAHVASTNNPYKACISAIAQMGIAGEIAKEKLLINEGNSSYRNYLIDAISFVDTTLIKERVKYEIF